MSRCPSDVARTAGLGTTTTMPGGRAQDRAHPADDGRDYRWASLLDDLIGRRQRILVAPTIRCRPNRLHEQIGIDDRRHCIDRIEAGYSAEAGRCSRRVLPQPLRLHLLEPRGVPGDERHERPNRPVPAAERANEPGTAHPATDP